MICDPMSAALISIFTPSQLALHPGSVKKHCKTSAYRSLLVGEVSVETPDCEARVSHDLFD